MNGKPRQRSGLSGVYDAYGPGLGSREGLGVAPGEHENARNFDEVLNANTNAQTQTQGSNTQTAATPTMQPTMQPLPTSNVVLHSGAGGCAWYQAPNAQGQCQFNAIRVLQSGFTLPSRIMAEPLMLLPEWLVPIASLGINAAVWYFVGSWALGLAKDQWANRKR